MDQDDDGTDLPEGPLAPPLKTPIEELSGSRWLVGGYNALEEGQRRVRFHALGQHKPETHLWYRGLTLYYVAQSGKWNLSGTSDGEVAARQVQMGLLGLGLSSAKVAIDTLLAGYYSPAYATIRHMLETVMQWFYLELFPDRAYLWRTPPTREYLKLMAMRAMKSELVEYAESFQPEADREKFAAYFHSIYRYWGRMSAGSHPSGAGLAQVILPESAGNRQIGANYDRHATLFGFDHGFFALRELLTVFETTNRVNDEWRQRLVKWHEEVDAFREASESDPAIAKAEAELERLRRAEAEAGEGAE